MVATCGGIKSATDFFMTLQGLYIFMSGLAIHLMFIDTQMKMKIGKVKLKKLSDTRWACQYATCLAVKKTIEAIIVTLVNIQSENSKRAAEASGFSAKLNFSFIFHLWLFLSLIHI